MRGMKGYTPWSSEKRKINIVENGVFIYRARGLGV